VKEGLRIRVLCGVVSNRKGFAKEYVRFGFALTGCECGDGFSQRIDLTRGRCYPALFLSMLHLTRWS
jgi:hypothetical protein